MLGVEDREVRRVEAGADSLVWVGTSCPASWLMGREREEIQDDNRITEDHDNSLRNPWSNLRLCTISQKM